MSSLGRLLLDRTYEAIAERDGRLLDVVPDVGNFVGRGGDGETWTDLGDWLHLASRLGAEKVLFVRNQPVIVFSDFAAAPQEAELSQLYRQTWSMSAPRGLFVALPDELRVYLLDQPPNTHGEPEAPWRALTDVGDVLSLLRDNDASGPDFLALPERASNAPAKADQRLIEDMRHVRDSLEQGGLGMAQAHALIGRSILVRYLEDRGVLTRAYFDLIAQDNATWQAILADSGQIPVFSAIQRERFYDRVLLDADFTHALFARLAEDFNGDLFAVGDVRSERLDAGPLRLLRSFLLGDMPEDNQKPLFFWAYDFKVVPLSLISSIYEQFYHDSLRRPTSASADADDGSDDYDNPEGHGSEGGEANLPQAAKDKGTHYTPASLVHDALHRTLTPECLADRPRILDLACGSGIFLVEAFRRVVRYEAHRLGRKLASSELRMVIRDRIAGIEINGEAARVAAFSLYLALLD